VKGEIMNKLQSLSLKQIDICMEHPNPKSIIKFKDIIIIDDVGYNRNGEVVKVDWDEVFKKELIND
jgi:hypothetical protein